MGKVKIIILIFLLFLAGCQSQTAKEPEVEKETFVDTVQSTPTPEEKVPEKEGSGLSEKITEDGTPKDAADKVITLKEGKAFGELIKVGTEDDIYCNLQQNLNNISSEEKLLLVCPDPVYGITYYVDYGGDYFIHAIKEGKEETIVEIPAKRLFCRGGKLYFMVKDYEKYALEGLINGDVLTYDPNDGKVTVALSGLGSEMKTSERTVTRGEKTIEVPEIVEVADTSMTIYQDGIYYTQKGENILVDDTYFYRPENNYYYSFETKELKQFDPNISFNSFTRWGKYLITDTFDNIGNNFEFTGNGLFNVETWEEEPLDLAWDVLSVLGDHVYTTAVLGTKWVGDGYSYGDAYSEIAVYNLKTGEEERHFFSRAENRYLSAFFMFNNEMYFSDLYYYSFQEKKEGKAYCNLHKDYVNVDIISEFYTDGEQLYGVSKIDKKLYKIEQHENSYTVPGTSHNYDRRFDFLPIGGQE